MRISGAVAAASAITDLTKRPRLLPRRSRRGEYALVQDALFALTISSRVRGRPALPVTVRGVGKRHPPKYGGHDDRLQP